jgi:O-phospho-L-seryl-tRNASec:L-selenocysteinyl-tRNA synthase
MYNRTVPSSPHVSLPFSGLQPVVVELETRGDQLVTSVSGVQAAIDKLGADNVAAVVTTTSCFAPR